MEVLLIKAGVMIDDSSNVPEVLKPIVKIICKAYIRLTNGLIGLDNVSNVCNAKFVAINPEDEEFSGSNKIFGMTETDYDKDCNISHVMSYVNDSDNARLITILTHELGHVLTESMPCERLENGIYPVIKKTNALYLNCFYNENGQLVSKTSMGFRTSDGFLEHMGTLIFENDLFLSELEDNGYMLGECVYKDPRLFPSRIYDEFKASFELFDYLLNGKLFAFSCKTYSNNQDIVSFINNNNYWAISKHLDKSNDALWQLKKYEGKPNSPEFEKDFLDYEQKKQQVLMLADLLYEEMDSKLKNDTKYQELKRTYEECIYTNTLLPFDSRGQAGSTRVREG